MNGRAVYNTSKQSIRDTKPTVDKLAGKFVVDRTAQARASAVGPATMDLSVPSSHLPIHHAAMSCKWTNPA